jgi:hypothetical protein
MSQNKSCVVSAISILFLAAAGQAILAPDGADAQAVQPTPTLNTKINQLRLNSRIHHPEHGEVSLEDLGKLEYGADKPGLELNRYLSIFVSDVDTTKAIKFSDVMSQLVRQSGDPQLTKDILFHQWWDTAGQGPGLELGPHCDDDGAPTPNDGIATNTATTAFNGFPYRCPRLEQSEALSDPFAKEGEVDAGKDANPGAYSAIALSNRFDLISPPVPAAGSAGLVEYPDCGEYRIVFARNSGKTDPLNRNLIIFEARVPNPDRKPEKIGNPSGCLPILNFWHSLSNTAITAEERGAKLRDFYLEGKLGPTYKPLPSPVVDVNNYAFGLGQIRTNQFMGNKGSPPNPVDWSLREFKTFPINGTLIIVPDTVKTNPGTSLFVDGSADPRVSVLIQGIRAQMRKILGGDNTSVHLDDVNKVGFSISGEGINSFESDEKGLVADAAFGDIAAAFKGNGSPRNDPLMSNIQGALNIVLPGGNVTPLQAVTRIGTQTCSGCHQFSNGSDLGGGTKWPDKAKGDLQGTTDRTNHPPMPFTQESEKQTDLREAISTSNNGKKGDRYAISVTVECLLDAREIFMRQAIGLPPAPGPAVNHCK